VSLKKVTRRGSSPAPLARSGQFAGGHQGKSFTNCRGNSCDCPKSCHCEQSEAIPSLTSSNL